LRPIAEAIEFKEMPEAGFERDHQLLEDESGINKKKNVMFVRKGRNTC
jgi:hypothetical protein